MKWFFVLIAAALAALALAGVARRAAWPPSGSARRRRPGSRPASRGSSRSACSSTAARRCPTRSPRSGFDTPAASCPDLQGEADPAHRARTEPGSCSRGPAAIRSASTTGSRSRSARRFRRSTTSSSPISERHPGGRRATAGRDAEATRSSRMGSAMTVGCPALECEAAHERRPPAPPWVSVAASPSSSPRRRERRRSLRRRPLHRGRELRLGSVPGATPTCVVEPTA